MKYSLVLLTIALTTTANSFMAQTPSFARKKSKKSLSFTSSSLNAGGGVTSQPASSDDSFSDENQRVEEPFLVASNPKLEAAWRFVKKPLLRIGDKGIAKSHANSLCELLLAHTVVKVKINTTKLGSWTDVFDSLKQSTQETGKIEGLEMIYYRPSENMLMVGRKGALKMIDNGEFPPPPRSDE